MLKAVSYILRHHQPWPSSTAARFATPSSTKGDLHLRSNTAVFIGDAVERKMESPASPDLQALVFSEYKGDATMKHNGVVLGNAYACEISRGYPGSTSDNRLHEVDEIGARIAGDGAFPSVYLYDKGLTHHNHIEKHGPLVMTPLFKEKGQMNFDHQDQINKKVARHRVIVEVVFGNCRLYNAFDKRIDLQRVDLSELEAQVVRCEVNMTCPPTGKDLTAMLSVLFPGEEAQATDPRDE